MAESSGILDIPATPAVIEWVDIDGQTRYLQEGLQLQPHAQISFDLYLDTSSNTSFLKLRIPFITKAYNKKSTSLYLFIPPERVTTLVAECSEVPNAVREQLGTDVTRLRFELNKPADLVMPHFHFSPRKRKFYQDTFYASATLAQRTAITLYVARPLTVEHLRPLCDAISLRELSSSESHADPIAVGGWICTEVNDLVQKYRPKPLYPAQVGPSRTRQQDDTSGAVSVIPPYTEESSSSPIAGTSFDGKPKKRPRYDSDADTEGEHAVFRRQVAEMFGELGKRMDAMNEEVQETKQDLLETKQDLLETKQELQATRLELQAAKRESKRETNRKLHATLKELLRLQADNRETNRETNRKLRATLEGLLETRETADAMREVDREALQATKQELGKELSELKAKMNQETLQLYRLSGQTAEMLIKRQDAREKLFYDAVGLLKGAMRLLSQMLGRNDEVVGGGDHHTTGSATAHRPGVSVDATAAGGGAPRATEPVPPPPTRSPFTTTATTTAPADSSTDSDPASPIVPHSTFDDLLPPPRTLPFPTITTTTTATTTNNLVDSGTDSDPASPGPASASVATSKPPLSAE
ncbi:hypothetical protein VPNG_05189 [Cytospora leucostoma]|uniref:Uncharacterized protein n=1 Tax=Cytospora leucostoma TaxID=1230097 RepID=A0A423X856_9PEZI|nr:hypothetical protein VPNG_05189 [Cytospora leucostoma]